MTLREKINLACYTGTTLTLTFDEAQRLQIAIGALTRAGITPKCIDEEPSHPNAILTGPRSGR